MDSSDSVEAVEKILNYSFVNKNPLREALTDKSYGSASFKRLSFVGEAALKLAFTNHIYLANPKLETCDLAKLREANTSKARYACVAVKHGFHQFFFIHRSPEFEEKIKLLSELVAKENEPVLPHFGEYVKVPSILADIIDSVAGAVYIDVNFHVPRLWEILRGLFEPLYTLDDLRLQPQPLRTLFSFGDKHGKRIDFKYEEHINNKTSKTTARVYLDDKFIARGRPNMCSDISRLSAAKAALRMLSESMPIDIVMDEDSLDFEIEDAKDKLIEICNKRKWPHPIYSVESKGDSRFVCSATIETPTEESTLYIKGGKRKRRKVAENAAASKMIRALKFSLKDDL